MLAAGAALAAAPGARAGLVASPLIVDVGASQPPRGDVELLNTGEDRIYVTVTPSRIEHAGRADEARVDDPDPQALGLIATPARLILEPGQRKFLRLALLQPAGEAERIFRVTIKPVVGEASGAATGLKLLVGYDMLVIQRPQTMRSEVTARREGDNLVLTNLGNTNVEFFRGRQCARGASACTDLPAHRLYPGAVVRVPVKPAAEVHYVSKVLDQVKEVVY